MEFENVLLKVLLLLLLVSCEDEYVFIKIENKDFLPAQEIVLDGPAPLEESLRPEENGLVDPVDDLASKVETFEIPASKSSVDILWVIDNSRSMKDNQKQLKDNFYIFLESFLDKDIDFQMGVITTDITRNAGEILHDVNLISKTQLEADETLFKIYLNGDELALEEYNQRSNKDIDFSTLEKNKDYSFLTKGTTGSPYEGGLTTSKMAIENNVGNNSDLFICDENRWTIIIVLSDEDEFFVAGDLPTTRIGAGVDKTYSESVSDEDLININTRVKNHVDSMKEELKKIGRDENKLKIYSIVNSSIGDLEKYPESIGHRYMFASEETGGEVYSIKSSYGETLANLSEDLNTSITKSITLSYEARPETIEVFYNGFKVNNNNFTYDGSSKVLTFTFSLLPLDEIVVNYKT